MLIGNLDIGKFEIGIGKIENYECIGIVELGIGKIEN